MDTPAGRGGRVIRVTNLNKDGPGSFKECVQSSGKRVCIFDVSGTIRLNGYISIHDPYLTIAGQTAPSPGIQIVGGGLRVYSNHTLIQHLRIRPGSQVDDSQRSNAISVLGGDEHVSNVVIDHCSLSWATDQNASVYGNVGDVTFYKSIVSEGLYNSTHPKGPHSMGPLLQGEGKARVAFIGNLLAHNNERNPLSRVNRLILANNVIYNFANKGTELQGGVGGPTYNAIIGNHYKEGPQGNSRAILMRGRGSSSDMTEGSLLYVSGNMAPTFDGSDPWSAVTMEDRIDDSFKASSPPISLDGLNVLPWEEATDWVLSGAGARPQDRDRVDRRVVNEVRTNTGRLIDNEQEGGGFPNFTENRRTLSPPENPNGDSDGDGYTNLEEWLHKLAREVE